MYACSSVWLNSSALRSRSDGRPKKRGCSNSRRRRAIGPLRGAVVQVVADRRVSAGDERPARLRVRRQLARAAEKVAVRPFADQTHFVPDRVEAGAAAQAQRAERRLAHDHLDRDAPRRFVGLAGRDPHRPEHAHREHAPLCLHQRVVAERAPLADRQPNLLPDDDRRDLAAGRAFDVDVAECVGASGVDDQRQVRLLGRDVDQGAPVDLRLRVTAVT